MPTINYAYETNEEKCGRAARLYARISTKNSVEVGRCITGMTAEKARKKLSAVIEKKEPVPYTKFNSDTAHRKGTGFGPGRFPVNVSREMLAILENACSNAENKGLDAKRLVVANVCATQGARRFRGRRAFGRRKSKNTHIQLTVEERK